MDYSARNTLKGKVVDVTHDRVTGLVDIEIADGIVISSDITANSVERLCLKPGKKVKAIIKANNVIIGVDDDK